MLERVNYAYLGSWGCLVFIVIGLDPFSLEYKSFPYRSLLGRISRDPFLWVSFLGFTKRGEQVIYLYTRTWLASILWLVSSAYIMPSVFIPSASGWPSTLLSRRPVELFTSSRRQSINKGWQGQEADKVIKLKESWSWLALHVLRNLKGILIWKWSREIRPRRLL